MRKATESSSSTHLQQIDAVDLASACSCDLHTIDLGRHTGRLARVMARATVRRWCEGVCVCVCVCGQGGEAGRVRGGCEGGEVDKG